MLEGRDWYKVEGAKVDEIQKFDKCFNNILPKGLLDLLRYSNGGEGPLEVQPYNFVLDSVDQIIETNGTCEISETFSGFIIFGSDGGGEYIAYDTTSSEVVSLDMCNTDISESRLLVAPDFNSFLKFVGVESK
ncbi:SMI1/KNR4 family protein [Photobacterium sanguinicancri]|uniref:SMI1/KNR4 family protein n=2 Tax=Photobacterium sanguinicancri TaxID=875932 RepID=UPI003D0EDCA9